MPDGDQPISTLGWATLVFFCGYWVIFLFGNAAAVLANRTRASDDDGMQAEVKDKTQ